MLDGIRKKIAHHESAINIRIEFTRSSIKSWMVGSDYFRICNISTYARIAVADIARNGSHT